MPLFNWSIILIFSSALLISCSEEPTISPLEKKKPKEKLVAVTEVTQESITRFHERLGTLHANRSVRIHSLEEGLIEALPWHEGDKVKQNDVLFSINDDLLQSGLKIAEARLNQAEQELKRIQRLIKSKAVSKDELVAAETERDVRKAEVDILHTRITRTSVKAPFDGTVTERLQEQGDLAQENGHIMTLIDPASMVIDVNVSELLLPRLKKGQKVQIRPEGEEQWFDAIISRQYPTVDTKSGDGKIEISAAELPLETFLGQTYQVLLKITHDNQLTIPYQSLQQSRQGNFVYVVNNANKAIRQRVETGIYLPDKVAVVSGLESGNKVIVRGFLGLKDGATVTVTQ